MAELTNAPAYNEIIYNQEINKLRELCDSYNMPNNVLDVSKRDNLSNCELIREMVYGLN